MNDMTENYEELAQIFIGQYNLTKGRHFEFECLRKSMFGIPKYEFPACEIYQMAFIEGQRHKPLVADLKVLLRLQKRLIIEVVKRRVGQETAKGAELSESLEHIVDPIERDALSEVVCSKYLLIDGRGFERIRIDDPEIYKKCRLERDRLFERHRQLILRKRDEREFEQDFSQLGIPTKHWFKEIWLSYYDEKGTIRCLQIW